MQSFFLSCFISEDLIQLYQLNKTAHLDTPAKWLLWVPV
jgi:hypothetical protein